MPLVIALVVLPTASSSVRICAPSGLTAPDISAMPCALSAIGPKVSSATTMPVVDSMPTPVRATRYTAKSTLPSPRPRPTRMATAMATTAHTADSMPLAMPDSTTVAGPVLPESAMSLTGLNWLEVKYCVMRLAT